jgi:hypothetical protein
MMNLKRISLFVELGVVALFASMLSGCFGDGGSPAYDGVWTAAVANSAPISISGVVATCTVTPPSVTLTNGVGSFQQTDSCNYTVSGVAYTQPYLYLVSVAITTSTGAVKAIVNGSTINGQCISSVGCAAQGGTLSLSLTR